MQAEPRVTLSYDPSWIFPSYFAMAYGEGVNASAYGYTHRAAARRATRRWRRIVKHNERLAALSIRTDF